MTKKEEMNGTKVTYLTTLFFNKMGTIPYRDTMGLLKIIHMRESSEMSSTQLAFHKCLLNLDTKMWIIFISYDWCED